MIIEPLISIIMPAYNANDTIKQSIESVMGQTYKNWELIIIDDCSKDETWELLCAISNIDNKITILQNPQNIGVSETRNKGVTESRGDWVAFLDSDDIWVADKLEKQVAAINKKSDAGLIFTGSAFIDAVGHSAKFHLQVPERITYRQLLKQNLISCSSVLVRKELLMKFPMKHDDMHEDYAVWLQILKAGYHAYGINEPLLIYRLSKKSKSGDKKKAAKMTFKVYRFMGLNKIQALYYFGWYAEKNAIKYYNIQKGLRRENKSQW